MVSSGPFSAMALRDRSRASRSRLPINETPEPGVPSCVATPAERSSAIWLVCVVFLIRVLLSSLVLASCLMWGASGDPWGVVWRPPCDARRPPWAPSPQITSRDQLRSQRREVRADGPRKDTVGTTVVLRDHPPTVAGERFAHPQKIRGDAGAATAATQDSVSRIAVSDYLYIEASSVSDFESGSRVGLVLRDEVVCAQAVELVRVQTVDSGVGVDVQGCFARLDPQIQGRAATFVVDPEQGA